MRKILSLFMVLAFFLHGTGTFPHSYAANNNASNTHCLAPVLVHSPQGSNRADTLQPALDMLQAYCLGKPSIPSDSLLPQDVARMCREVSPASIGAIISMVREGKLRWLDCIRHEKETHPRIKELLDSLVVPKEKEEETGESLGAKEPDPFSSGEPVVAVVEEDIPEKPAEVTLEDIETVSGQGKAGIQLLINALANKDSLIRAAVVKGLVNTGQAAIPALLKALRSKRMLVRKAAVRALGKLVTRGRGKAVVLRALAGALQDSEWWVRKTTIRVLVQIGVKVVPVLLDRLDRTQPEYSQRAMVRILWLVRKWVYHFLAKRGIKGLTSHLAALQAARSDAFKAILQTLGGIGSQLTADSWQTGRERVISVGVRALGDVHGAVRESAAIALGKVVRQGAAYDQKILSGLVKVLSDEDPAIREAVADTLGKIGPRAVQYKETIPALVFALQDQEQSVREAAAKALAKLGAIPALQEALAGDDEHVRLAVLGAFRRVRIAPQYLSKGLVGILVKVLENYNRQMELLEDKYDCENKDYDAYYEEFRLRYWDVRAACSWILGDIVPGMDLVQAEVAPVVRALWGAEGHAAVKSLIKMGLRAIPFLLQILDSGRVSDRRLAAEILGKMGTVAAKNKEVIPALLNALGSEENGFRVVQALGKIVPTDKVNSDILQALNCVLLNDNDNVFVSERTRIAAGTALAHMGPEAFPYLRRALDKGLRERNRELCQSVAMALGQMGATPGCPQDDIVLHLLRALDSWDAMVRLEAESAFKHVGPAAIPVLLPYLDRRIWRIRCLAIRALRAVGTVALVDERVVASLMVAFRDKDPRVKQSAAYTLIVLKCPIEDETVMWAVYMAALDTENNFCRQGVAKALGNIAVGPDNKQQILAALNKALKDKESGVRRYALISLSRVASTLEDNQYLLVTLLKALKEEDENVRFEALKGLKKNISLFDDKEPIVSALKVLLQEEEEGPISWCAEAFVKEIASKTLQKEIIPLSKVRIQGKRGFHRIDELFADRRTRAMQVLLPGGRDLGISWIDGSLVVSANPKDSTERGIHCSLVYRESEKRYFLKVQSLLEDNTQRSTVIAIAENIADLRCSNVILDLCGQEHEILSQNQQWQVSSAGIKALLALAMEQAHVAVLPQKPTDTGYRDSEEHQLGLANRKRCACSA